MHVISDDNHTIFTVCNLAYLPKALVLAESILIFNNTKVQIFIIDKKVDVELPVAIAKFTWIEDVGVPNLYQLAFKYDITEFSTSVKPFITLKLLESFDKVIFLDPDICVYHALNGILADLDKHPIVLTPHYLTPQNGDLPESDVGMMRFGSFNLGFFAVSRTEEALSFLRWWCDRCFRLCYFEAQIGLSTDQKWVSIAPCFFPNLHVSFNMGYNMAFWNVHERLLGKSSEGDYIINGQYPLVFFHFSSFDDRNPELLSKRLFPERGQGRKDWLEISAIYSAALLKYTVEVSKTKYAFDYMSNGDYISPTFRRAYASVELELPAGHDPFDSDGPVGRFAKKNFLIEKNCNPYVADSYGAMSKHKVKFLAINFLMRIVLRVLGPNRFSNFSRLLVYLSSYRNNRNMWNL